MTSTPHSGKITSWLRNGMRSLRPLMTGINHKLRELRRKINICLPKFFQRGVHLARLMLALRDLSLVGLNKCPVQLGHFLKVRFLSALTTSECFGLRLALSDSIALNINYLHESITLLFVELSIEVDLDCRLSGVARESIIVVSENFISVILSS